MPEFTRWLNASNETRDDELFVGLYGELKRIAASRMARGAAGSHPQRNGTGSRGLVEVGKKCP